MDASRPGGAYSNLGVMPPKSGCIIWRVVCGEVEACDAPTAYGQGSARAYPRTSSCRSGGRRSPSRGKGVRRGSSGVEDPAHYSAVRAPAPRAIPHAPHTRGLARIGRYRDRDPCGRTFTHFTGVGDNLLLLSRRPLRPPTTVALLYFPQVNSIGASLGSEPAPAPPRHRRRPPASYESSQRCAGCPCHRLGCLGAHRSGPAAP